MLKGGLSCCILVVNDMLGIKSSFLDSDLGYIDFTAYWVLTFWRFQKTKTDTLNQEKSSKLRVGPFFVASRFAVSRKAQVTLHPPQRRRRLLRPHQSVPPEAVQLGARSEEVIHLGLLESYTS